MDSASSVNNEADQVEPEPNFTSAGSTDKQGLIRKATKGIMKLNPLAKDDPIDVSSSTKRSHATTPRGTKKILGFLPSKDKDKDKGAGGGGGEKIRNAKAISFDFERDPARGGDLPRQGSAQSDGTSDHREQVYDIVKRKPILGIFSTKNKHEKEKTAAETDYLAKNSMADRAYNGEKDKFNASPDDFAPSLSEKARRFQNTADSEHALKNSHPNKETIMSSESGQEACEDFNNNDGTAFKLRVLQREFDAYKKVYQDNLDAELRLKDSTIEHLTNSLKTKEEELKRVRKKAKYYYNKSQELASAAAEQNQNQNQNQNGSDNGNKQETECSSGLSRPESLILHDQSLNNLIQPSQYSQIQNSAATDTATDTNTDTIIKQRPASVDDRVDDEVSEYEEMFVEETIDVEEAEPQPQHEPQAEPEPSKSQDSVEIFKQARPFQTVVSIKCWDSESGENSELGSNADALVMDLDVDLDRDLMQGQRDDPDPEPVAEASFSIKKKYSADSIKKKTLLSPSKITRKKSSKKITSQKNKEGSFIYLNSESSQEEESKSEPLESTREISPDDNSTMTTRVSSLPPVKSSIFKEKDALELENNWLKHQLAQLNREFAQSKHSYNVAIDDLETENKSLKDQLAQFHMMLAQLKQAQDASKDDLKIENNSLKDQLAQLHQELAQSKKEQENELKIGHSLESDLALLKENFNNRQLNYILELEKTKREKNNVLAEKESLEKQLSDLKQVEAGENKLLSSCTTKQDFFERDITLNQQQQQVSYLTEIETLKQERDKVLTERNLLEKQVSDFERAQAEYNSKLDELSSIKQIADERKLEIDRLKKVPVFQESSTASETEERRLELEKMKAELTLAKDQLRELDSLKQTIVFKDKEIGTLQNTVAIIEAESKRDTEMDNIKALLSEKQKLLLIIEDQEKEIEKLQVQEKSSSMSRDVDISVSDSAVIVQASLSDSNQDQLTQALNDKNKMQEQLLELEKELTLLKQSRNAQKLIESAREKAAAASKSTESENNEDTKIHLLETQKLYYESLVKGLHLEKENAVQKVQALETNFFLVPKERKSQDSFLKEIPAFQEAVEQASISRSSSANHNLVTNDSITVQTSDRGGNTISREARPDINRIVTFVSLVIAVLSVLIMLIKGRLGN